MCGDILKPDFHVDHIIELRDGGVDEYDNLQTLCSVSPEKTRINTLKHHKIFQKAFGQRAKEIEDNAFKKFQHVRKSKYFKLQILKKVCNQRWFFSFFFSSSFVYLFVV